MNSLQTLKSLAILAGIVASILIPGQSTAAQDRSHSPKLAVLRFKASQATPDRRTIVNDFSAGLAAALRGDTSLDVRDDAAVLEALHSEGMKPDGLLKEKECLNVGEALGVDYLVVGSALLQGQKWHACVRVLSVKPKALKSAIEAEYPANEMHALYGVLASRISQSVRLSTPENSSPADFKWNNEFLFSFGPHRVDLEPPILFAQNAQPPFELSIVADMAVARGNYAVSNFEMFVDDMSLGTVHPDLVPPIPLKDRRWVIGGHKYLFSIQLKELRFFSAQVEGEETKFISSARISVAVKSIDSME